MLSAGTLAPTLAAVRVARVGYVDGLTQKSGQGLFDAFRSGMRALGWTEGGNLMILDRWADGDDARLPSLISGLLQDGIDVLVTAGVPSTQVARKLAGAMPIVLVGVFDPVRLGFVASLAKPGGNVTGMSSMASDTTAKQLQILQEVVPSISRVAVLGNLGEVGGAELWEGAQRGARQLDVTVDLIDVRTQQDIEVALPRLRGGGYDGFLSLGGTLNYTSRARILALVSELRLPAVYPFRGFTSEGGLLSFGPDRLDLFRRAASFVDKILHGKAPADLPVEQPTRFELVINLRTANALGLTIPHRVVARADDLIE